MAKGEKKGFVLYYDYQAHLSLLSDEERGKLLMALFDYGENGKEPELEGAALMAYSFIRAQMNRDAEKYAETCRKRSEAGKQGGRPSKAEPVASAGRNQKPKQPKSDTMSILARIIEEEEGTAEE